MRDSIRDQPYPHVLGKTHTYLAIIWLRSAQPAAQDDPKLARAPILSALRFVGIPRKGPRIPAHTLVRIPSGGLRCALRNRHRLAALIARRGASSISLFLLAFRAVSYLGEKARRASRVGAYFTEAQQPCFGYLLGSLARCSHATLFSATPSRRL